MAIFALTDAVIWADEHDFSCDSNRVNLGMTAQELNVTTFCSDGWDEVIGGLKTVECSVDGFWQAAADSVHVSAFDNLGSAKTAMTVAGTSTAGSKAVVFAQQDFDYSFLGADVGQVAPFSLRSKGVSATGAGFGQIIAAKQDVSSTGALTGYQVGAVGASETLLIATHVFSAGTSVTFDIESDDNGSFTSATSQATIGALSATGGTLTTVSGAVTDDYWRINVTACTGTFSMAVAIGIA